MTIDVHAHLVPPAIFDAVLSSAAEYGVDLVKAKSGYFCCKFAHGLQVRPVFESLINVDQRLETMDRQGIEREILSLWADLFGYGLPPEQGARWHGLLNDKLAGLAESRPERFSWMGSVPLQHAGLAVKELERCKAAGAVGTIVAANVEGENLGERELEDFWAASAELRMPVFIHPAQPESLGRSRRFGLNQVCNYTADTTFTVGSLILSGVLDRHPQLDLLLSHGGGHLPFLAGRFDIMHAKSDRSHTGDIAASPPSSYLKRMYYDTILHDPEALQYLRRKVGIERMLLGTDEPFPVADSDPLGSLKAAQFTPEEIDRIAVANARALFRSLPQ